MLKQESRKLVEKFSAISGNKKGGIVDVKDW